MRTIVKRVLAASLAMGCCTALTACSSGTFGLPTKGLVQTLAPLEQEDRRVYINPQGPDRDAQPEDIVNGFYDAMPAGVQSDGFKVAREYLTSAAAAGWNGDASAVVYDGVPDISRRTNTMDSVQSSDKSMVVEVDLQVVGRLDSHGLYMAADGGRTEQLLYELTNRDGQWRISSLEDGVAVSAADFEQVFRQVSVYQVDNAGKRLVPDVRWLSWRNWRTQAVKEVLGDASGWLKGTVQDPNPGNVKMTVDAVPVNGNRAQVSLDDKLGELGEADRALLVRRIRLTLGDGSAGYQFEVSGGGVDYSNADDAVGLDADLQPNMGVYTLTGGHVVSLSSSSPLRIGEVEGYEQAEDFAFSSSGGAILRKDGAVTCLGPDGASCGQMFSGTRMRAIGAGLDGEIWCVGEEGRTLHVFRAGKETTLEVPWLGAGEHIVSLAVSPEGARLALALGSGQDGDSQGDGSDGEGASASVALTGIARDAAGQPTALGAESATVSVTRRVAMLTFYNELNLVYATDADSNDIQKAFRQMVPGPASTQRLPDQPVVSMAAGQISQARRLAVLDDLGNVRSVSGSLDGSWNIADIQVAALGRQ